MAEDYGMNLSRCQVILLSEPDILPEFSRPAIDFANKSFLIISSSRYLSVVKRPKIASAETVSVLCIDKVYIAKASCFFNVICYLLVFIYVYPILW